MRSDNTSSKTTEMPTDFRGTLVFETGAWVAAFFLGVAFADLALAVAVVRVAA